MAGDADITKKGAVGKKQLEHPKSEQRVPYFWLPSSLPLYKESVSLIAKGKPINLVVSMLSSLMLASSSEKN